MACNCNKTTEEYKTKIIVNMKDGSQDVLLIGRDWNNYEYNGTNFITKIDKVYTNIYSMDCVKCVKVKYF